MCYCYISFSLIVSNMSIQEINLSTYKQDLEVKGNKDIYGEILTPFLLSKKCFRCFHISF